MSRRIIKGMLLLAVVSACGFSFVKEASPQKRPNILFAIMDDATYRHMGAYGCTWVKTPNFDRVAKSGLLFRNAYTPNAKCAPSRSVILTGRNSWQLEEAGNHWSYFPAKFATVAGVMAKNGYKTGFTGKGCAPVVAKKADGSPRELLVKAWNQVKTVPPTPAICNVDYAANFEAFLTDRKDEPFFFWYGGLEPHRDYTYGSGIAKGKKKISDVPDKDVYDFWPKVDSVKTDLLDYAFEIEYFDRQLGKMLDLLEKRGELHNTLVVVTSDNGMPFPRVKGQAYEYSNHLPLAIMWADGIQHPNRAVTDFISFADFAPTFLELAGIRQEKSGMQPITGASFTDLFSEQKSNLKRSSVLIGKERHDVGRPNDEGYPIRGIIRDGLLYIHNFKTDRWPAGNPETGYLNTDGSPTKTVCLNTVWTKNNNFNYWLWSFGKRPGDELYDIARDPQCMHNLAGDKKHIAKMTSLRTELFRRLKAEGDPRAFGRGDVFDHYAYADKGGVNFYGRYLQKDTTLKWAWVNDSDFQDLSKNSRAKTARTK